MPILRALWPRLRIYRARLAGAAVSMAITAAVSGGVYFLKPLVDRLFVSRDPRMLYLAVFVVPAITVLRSLAAYTQNYLLSYVGQQMAQGLRLDLFAHLHELSMDFFWKRRSGDILSRATSDLQQVESTIHFLPLYLIRDTLTLFVLLFVLFFLNVKFAFLALLGLPLVGVILWVLGKKMRRSSLASQTLMAELYQRFSESLQGMLVIKAFHYEKGSIRRFDQENRQFFGQMMRYLRATALSGPLMEVMVGLILTAILYLAGRQILAGTLTPGDFITFTACFMMAYNPTKNIARSNAELQRGLAAAGRILEILHERPTVPEPVGARNLQPLKRGFELRSVSYRYPDRETWALKDVSLEIRPGQVVGLVGPSGSGKSTLALLLLRLCDPTEGAVLADGIPLTQASSESLRSQFGLVTQETFLFHDTVSNNVAIGKDGASKEEIEAACRLADADGFIRQLPQGYDTVLGDRGVKLSGGQRQRLAIARAVLKQPPILLLDEATSNLDSASEEAIQKAIERAMRGRTVIMIAHRLSTVQGADRIFVMSGGSVAETGNHAQLLAANGLYARLYQMQGLGEEASPSRG